MQFIKNGPEVPEALIQAHEDGRVVFFCGAGISYPAGLPGFRGLVDQIYDILGTVRTDIENQAYSRGQFDATLDLLERRIPGQRVAVRSALANILKPKLRRKGATETHAALLQLARNREGVVRLVTTNFDCIFQRLMKRVKPTIPSYPAPLLPIPKNSRWDGVVYLHGLLPEVMDESALNRLVLTSGDFGLAYLTERWAARFVSELFRNYIVCFVGYSINDPVLRYMMDALAADRMLGEITPQAYAFGEFEIGQESQQQVEWEAKGVTPILYPVHNSGKDHSALHLTLKEWAEIHRDGALGKESIVTRYAVNPPIASTREDNFVGRILWAISDKSSLPARKFAELNPVPPLDWLYKLSEAQFGHSDLLRFGVIPKGDVDKKLSFSLVNRPTPYTLAARIALVNFGSYSGWDGVMFEVARWLLRHLDDPNLILWLAKNGGQVHRDFAWLITQKIQELDRLHNEDKQEELDRIRANSPKAIPGVLTRTLWRLLLSGRLISRNDNADLYGWFVKLKQDGMTPTLRIELREILTPCVRLTEPFSYDGETRNLEEPKRISDIVRWDIELSVLHPHSALADKRNYAQWNEALPDLLQDFSALLKDVLDLKRELGGADATSDHSYYDQPSISEHPQNKDFHDWTVLIELNRDAWLALSKVSEVRARLAAESWWHTPYPLFKRLALFAATQDAIISPGKALEWILSDNSWWLWSEEVRRELMRLLAYITPVLNTAEQDRLLEAILLGPPREMFKKDIELDRWNQIVDRSIWLRLAKIQHVGRTLPLIAQQKFTEITGLYPQWQVAIDQRDEFPVWMESGIDNDPLRTHFRTPRQRRELVAWIKENPKLDFWQTDDWRQRCSENLSTTTCALISLAHEGEWPSDRWRDALQAWAEDKLLKRSWRRMAPIIIRAPEELILACAHGIGWWLESIAKTFDCHEEHFFNLTQRILNIDPDEEFQTDDPVGRAINNPIGQVTEAVLRWWYRQSPQDGEGLPHNIKTLFTAICNTDIHKFRNGRVLLATHGIALFRVDNEWTSLHLVPLFNWATSELEAQSAWEGFLWAPRLYQPFLGAVKQPFLDTASHYSKLGTHARQYAEFLTFAALETTGDIITNHEFANATRVLPSDGLHNAAQALARAQEGATDKHGEYWRNRLKPYLNKIWPNSRELISPKISECFARVCIGAGEEFSNAVLSLKNWLVPIDHPDYVIHLLHQSSLSSQYPESALTLMDKIIADDLRWPPSHLGDCLQAVAIALPQLQTDTRYQRLVEYLRRLNGR